MTKALLSGGDARPTTGLFIGKAALRKTSLSFICVAFILIGASCSSVNEIEKTKSSLANGTNSWHCEPAPETFNKSDLAGLWQTTFDNGSETDSIVLNENGFYKEYFVNSNTGYIRETDLNYWSIEEKQNGGKYIHLKGMLYCVTFTGVCMNPQDIQLGFYDKCEDRWLNLKGELILAIVGDKTAPRGIRLKYMKPAGFENFFIDYVLVNEQ